MGRFKGSDGILETRLGDTASDELLRDKNRVFSFKIAIRSVGLEPPVTCPWPPIPIQTLADNIGAKINALVDRGAPEALLTSDSSPKRDC